MENQPKTYTAFLRNTALLLAGLLALFTANAQNVTLYPESPSVVIELKDGAELMSLPLPYSQNILVEGQRCQPGQYHVAIALRYEHDGVAPAPGWELEVEAQLYRYIPRDPDNRGSGLLTDFKDPASQTVKFKISDSPQTYVSSAFYALGDPSATISCQDKDDQNRAIDYMLEITSVTGHDVPEGKVFLESWLYQEPQYGIPESLEMLSITDISASAGQGFVDFDWSYPAGESGEKAWEWELEWTLINSFSNGETPFSDAAEAFAYQEPARITLGNDAAGANIQQGYQMQLTYPEGWLYARIRAVGRHSQEYPEQPVYSDWTYYASPAPIVASYYNWQGFEPDMNWQATSTFAEDAKSKKVVSYFDGSLRSRQTQTDLSTDGNVLVAESFLDHEGRPSISILPTPTQGRSLEFKEAYNTFNLESVLDKNDYTNSEWEAIDIRDVYDHNLLASPKLAADASGAGNYYSGASHAMGIHKEYVPDANGYAYTQVSYMNDGTGRVREQSGVGEAFRLRNGLAMDGRHTTAYFYGGVAKEELTRLFGTQQLGDIAYYRKQMVLDPNRQLSISYLDAADRVIATALAGGEPANLDALPSKVDAANSAEEMTVDISDKNHIDLDRQVSEISHTILNTSANAVYTFDYAMTPTFTKIMESEITNEICLSCEYELTVRIVDGEGNVVMLAERPATSDCVAPSASDSLQIRKLFKGSELCDPNEDLSEQLRFCAQLSAVGSYTLTKTLRQVGGGMDIINQTVTLVEDADAYGDLVAEREAALAALQAICEDRFSDITVDDGSSADPFIPTTMGIPCDVLESQRDRYEPEVQAILDRHIEACHQHTSSDAFDAQLFAQTSWQEAVSGVIAFANPTNMTKPLLVNYPFREYAISPDEDILDPFFFEDGSYGKGMAGNMNNKLSNITFKDEDGNRHQVSIWQLLLFQSQALPDFLKPRDASGNLLSDIHPDAHKNILFTKPAPNDPNQQIFLTETPSAEYPNGEVDAKRMQLFRDFYLGTKIIRKAKIWESEPHNAYFDERLSDLIPDPRDYIKTTHEVVIGNIVDAHDLTQPDFPYQAATTRDYLLLQLELNVCQPDLSGGNLAIYDQLNSEIYDVLLEYYSNKTPADFFGIIDEEDFPAGNLCGNPGALTQQQQRLCEVKSLLGEVANLCGGSTPTNSDLDGLFSQIVFENPYDCSPENSIMIEQPVGAYGFFNGFAKATSNTGDLDFLSNYAGESYTVEAWIKLDNLDSDRPISFRRALISKRLGETEGYEIGINQEYLPYLWLNGEVYTGTEKLTSGAGLPDCNNCHHLALVVDDDANGLQIRWSVDGGTLNGGAIIPAADKPAIPADPDFAAQPLYLGGNYQSERLGAFAQDLRVWRKALQETDMGFALGYSLPEDDSGLAAHWRMDEGKGQLLEDAAGVLNAFISNDNCSNSGYTSFDTRDCAYQPLNITDFPVNYMQDFEAGFPYWDGWRQPSLNCGASSYQIGVVSSTQSNGNTVGGPSGDFLYIPEMQCSDNFYVQTQAFTLNSTSEATLSFHYGLFFESSNENPSWENNLEISEEGSGNWQPLNISLGYQGVLYWQMATATIPAGFLGKTIRFRFKKPQVFNVNGNMISRAMLIDNFELEQKESLSGCNDLVATHYQALDFEEGVLHQYSYSPAQLSSDAGGRYINIHASEMTFPGNYYIATHPVWFGKCFDLRKGITNAMFQFKHGSTYSYHNDIKLKYVVYATELSGDNPIKHKISTIEGGPPSSVVDWLSVTVGLNQFVGKVITLSVEAQIESYQQHNVPTDMYNFKFDDFKLYTDLGCEPTWLQEGCLTREVQVCSVDPALVDAIVNPEGADNPYVQPVDIDALVDDCVAEGEAAIWEAFHAAVANLQNEAIASISTQSFNDCFDEESGKPHGYEESLSYTFKQTEYHYTLYYYDQAGSLVQTVPPAGVNTDGSGTHELATRYAYNTLGQLSWQHTPDGGESKFWYDDLGRLRFSQNAEQATGGRFSYTKYDEQGRIVEVGELSEKASGWHLLSDEDNDGAADDIREDWLNSVSLFPDEAEAVSYTLDERTITHYDELGSLAGAGISGSMLAGFEPTHLRGRVAWTEVRESRNASMANATLYSYDVHGNVDKLLQVNDNIARQTCYDYDLVSGNVKHVIYNPNKPFIHRYAYDADNRLETVYTSQDGYVWSREAKYQYYAHGPLARTELGEYRVQGLDYFYTLQGWLKGVNMPGDDFEDDPGKDGASYSANQLVGRDRFAYMLGYYEGDYRPIGFGGALGWEGFGKLEQQFGAGHSLYNGNIGWMATDLKFSALDEQAGTQTMAYRYDQLNRIREATAYRQDGTTGDWTNAADAYKASFSYDPSGNIETLHRRNGLGELMDELSYSYKANNNQLRKVADAGAVAGGYELPADVANDPDIYVYDEIGNLVEDKSEGIVAIEWTVYGKVASVDKGDGKVSYRYGADGNRTSKQVTKNGQTAKLVYYFRDASGNIMETYSLTEGKPLPDGSETIDTKHEYPIYGSSRLGLYKTERREAVATKELLEWNETFKGHQTLGNKQYELSNHLGNVLAVIYDNIDTPPDAGGTPLPAGAPIDFYEARAVTAQDYYPFGLAMEERSLKGTFTKMVPVIVQTEKVVYTEDFENGIGDFTPTSSVGVANDGDCNIIVSSMNLQFSTTPVRSGRSYEHIPAQTSLTLATEPGKEYELVFDLKLGAMVYEGWGQRCQFCFGEPQGLAMAVLVDEQLFNFVACDNQATVRFVAQGSQTTFGFTLYFEGKWGLPLPLMARIDDVSLVKKSGVNTTQWVEKTFTYEEYRFSFNGKENDGDFGGGIQDYGFRLYNPSISKFLSVDPLAPEYPELTPYQFASNIPIWAIDLDGLEATAATNIHSEKTATTKISITTQVFNHSTGNGVHSQYEVNQTIRAVLDRTKMLIQTKLRGDYKDGVTNKTHSVSAESHFGSIISGPSDQASLNDLFTEFNSWKIAFVNQEHLVDDDGNQVLGFAANGIGETQDNTFIIAFRGTSQEAIYQMANTLFHELGHGLGLAHPDREDATSARVTGIKNGKRVTRIIYNFNAELSPVDEKTSPNNFMRQTHRFGPSPLKRGTEVHNSQLEHVVHDIEEDGGHVISH